MAYIVLSTPAMFENYFIPFIREEILSARDPIDECVRKHLEHIMKALKICINSFLDIF